MGIILNTMERYLKSCFGKYTEQSIKRFRSDLNVAGSFEESENCYFLSISSEKLKDLFVSYHCFSIQSFRDKKSLLLRYLSWLEQQGECVNETHRILTEISYEDVSSDNEFGRYYFGSFPQLSLFLQAHIDHIAEETKRDKDEFLTAEVLAALAWHGITAAEACALQKTDVYKKDQTLLLRLSDRQVALNKEASDWVKKFISANGFERLKGGEWEAVSYRKGTALLRTTKSSSMTPKSIANMLTRLNVFIPDADKVFLYARIYASGKFFRAYQKEMENPFSVLERKAGSPVRLAEREYYEMLFETEYTPKNNYKLLREIRLYQEFKKYFYTMGQN